MSIQGLDLSTINELLKEEKRQATTKGTDSGIELPKPIQIGPLKYANETARCVSKRCGSPTLLRYKGIPYCSTHALYEMNKAVLDREGFDYSDCNCNAGMHSKMSCHTFGCPVWERVKSDSIAESDASA